MTITNDGAPLAPMPRDPRQDPNFDPGREAKRLLRLIRVATLATLNETGAPFATLTTVATDYDGTPILLLSRLARHTGHLESDGRCSLLLAQGGRGDPMAHPRLTLNATAAPVSSPRARARFLRRNPKASLYADFGDFGFWRAELDAVHLNAGFGRAASFDPGHLMTNIRAAQALIDAEAELLDEFNVAQADALEACVEKLDGPFTGKWRASGVDPEGIDLVSGDETARIDFPRIVSSPQEAREVVIDLARLARGG